MTHQNLEKPRSGSVLCNVVHVMRERIVLLDKQQQDDNLVIVFMCRDDKIDLSAHRSVA